MYNVRFEFEYYLLYNSNGVIVCFLIDVHGHYDGSKPGHLKGHLPAYTLTSPSDKSHLPTYGTEVSGSEKSIYLSPVLKYGPVRQILGYGRLNTLGLR